MHEPANTIDRTSIPPRLSPAGVRPAHRAAVGFTVLEMLIVITILAILASMFVPRLLGSDVREFRLTAERVADLMTMYAKRDHLSQKPIALRYDVETSRLYLLIYDVDYEGGDEEPYWHADRNTRPVYLPEFVELTNVIADGMSIDISRWPLQNRPGQQRQSIDLILTGPANERVRITLPPYAVAPIVDGLGRETAHVRRAVDLNATGRSREEW